jgi:hypothetical protein
MTGFQNLGSTAQPGPRLLAEIERQLLGDLAFYGVANDDLRFDWSEACGEGHCTSYLDGTFEELSGVALTNSSGEVVAEGWVDFIHGGGDNPLFVFWLFLSLADGRKLKTTPTIPEHVWERLPQAAKDLCAVEGSYDSRWSKDPFVVQWRRK